MQVLKPLQPTTNKLKSGEVIKNEKIAFYFLFCDVTNHNYLNMINNLLLWQILSRWLFYQTKLAISKVKKIWIVFHFLYLVCKKVWKPFKGEIQQLNKKIKRNYTRVKIRSSFFWSKTMLRSGTFNLFVTSKKTKPRIHQFYIF